MYHPKTLISTLLFFLLALTLLLQSPLPPTFTTTSLHQSTNPFASFQSSTTTIPNIVHFVHLVGSERTLTLELPFRQFIAIYSAWYYLKPEKIFIHTDIEDDLLEYKIQNTKSPYTRAIAKLPGVQFKYHEAITKTTTGNTIHELPNQSDFVRTDVLEQYGGIYLDDDAYVLRDLAPLRNLPYQNIVGRQGGGQICPAVLLAAPHNKMMSAYHALQDSIFDGEWQTHATKLLTTLVRDFQDPDGQVLILDKETFFPLSWLHDDLVTLYGVNKESSLEAVNNRPTENLAGFVEDFHLDGPETWKRDWRLSYVLHGWTTSLKRNLERLEQEDVFGEFREGITLDYVLAGRSNFALAVRPAIRHAVDTGVLDHVGNMSTAFGGGEAEKGGELRSLV